MASLWLQTMKQISEVEEIPFKSSLNVCPKPAVETGGEGRSNASPPPTPHTTLILRWARIFKRFWSPGIYSKEWIPGRYDNPYFY